MSAAIEKNILRFSIENRNMNGQNLIELFERYLKGIKEKLGELSYIPVIFISVHDKQRIYKAIEKAIEVFNNRVKKIATSLPLHRKVIHG